MKKSIFLATFLLITGCATAPMASLDKDIKAKSFETAPEVSSLYIYRNENFGGAISMDITVNGKPVGQTAAKSYFKFDVTPGDYHVESKAENVSFIDVSLEAGKNYFIWQEVKMGFLYARSKLQLVDEEKGKKGVLESRMINTIVTKEDLALKGVEVASKNTTSVKLGELKSLLNKGDITQSEYDQAKAKILEEFK